MMGRDAASRARRGRAPAGAPAARGFTLIELLVAITILAFISVIAWRGLSTLTATRERLAPQNEQARSILAGFGQMEIDLANVPLNAVLYALPTQTLRVFVADGRKHLQLLRLTQAPDGSGASAYEYVFYRVQDGVLERQSSAAQRFYSSDVPTQLESVALVPGVDELQIRVWRPGVGWIEPVADSDSVGVPGVEVRLRRHDGTTLRRVFMVG
jgi:general secretion pathway protein J